MYILYLSSVYYVFKKKWTWNTKISFLFKWHLYQRTITNTKLLAVLSVISNYYYYNYCQVCRCLSNIQVCNTATQVKAPNTMYTWLFVQYLYIYISHTMVLELWDTVSNLFCLIIFKTIRHMEKVWSTKCFCSFSV